MTHVFWFPTYGQNIMCIYIYIYYYYYYYYCYYYYYYYYYHYYYYYFIIIIIITIFIITIIIYIYILLLLLILLLIIIIIYMISNILGTYGNITYSILLYSCDYPNTSHAVPAVLSWSGPHSILRILHTLHLDSQGRTLRGTTFHGSEFPVPWAERWVWVSNNGDSDEFHGIYWQPYCENRIGYMTHLDQLNIFMGIQHDSTNRPQM